MGRRKTRGVIVPSSSENSSKQGTPAASDSEGSDGEPAAKKPKTKRGPKTSADICEQHGLVNVDDEYTEADYMNLTNYGLFVRMVRPQVLTVNPKISSSKMAALMEAKWREFREGNPLTKKRREEDTKKDSPKKPPPQINDDDEDEDDDTEVDDEDEAEEIIPQPPKRGSAAKAATKKTTPKSGKKYVDDDDDDEEEDVTPRRQTSRQTKPSYKIRDNEEEDEDEDDDDDVSSKGRKKTPAKRQSKGKAGNKRQSSGSKPSSRKQTPAVSEDDDVDEEAEDEWGDEPDEQLQADSDDDEQSPKKRTKSIQRKPVRKPVQLVKLSPKKKKVASDDEDEDDMDSDDGGSAKKKKPGIKIRLPAFTPVRKSGRDRKTVLPVQDYKKVLESEEDESDNSGPTKKRGRASKRKASSEESYSEDSEAEGRKKSKKGTKRTKKTKTGMDSEDEVLSEEIEDDEVEEEEEEEDEEEDIDSDDDPRSRRDSRPVIPGERKSERSRKTISYDQDDKAFDKMLKKRDKEETERVAQQKKKQAAKKRAEKIAAARAKKKEEEKEAGNESDHFYYCDICEDGGDIILCDTCPRSFHKECIKLEGELPEGDWSCPKCEAGEPKPEKPVKQEAPEEEEEEEPEEEHDTICSACKDGGDVLLCDFCPAVYHQMCLNPPLIDIPDGDWKCPKCVIRENPLKGHIKKILTWRWKNKPNQSGEDEFDHTHSPDKRKQLQEKKTGSDKWNGKGPPQRELFVRYANFSYWDCEWVSELQLEVFQSILWRHFVNKWDMDEPPALEDGSSFGNKRHRKPEEDPHNLEEKYYRYSIKPEWLQIHRIINHEEYKNKKRNYLVKWQDLVYDECTWEDPDEIVEELQEEFDKHIKLYQKRRKAKLKEEKEKQRDLKPKKSTLKKKLEKQPDYIEATGGTLHPYQLEGLNWLRFSWAQDTNTILADEMGLGKTIQAISIIYSLYKEGFVKGPFLISAPLSTVPNWEREFAFWAPDLYVVNYTGLRESRIALREHEFSYKEGAFPILKKPSKMRKGFKPKFDVLLTSYEMVSMDLPTLQSIHWDILVIDEAHRLKSNQSLYFRTLMKYDISYKLLLTGTPLQNNLEELFNLLNFLEPNIFSDMEDFLDNFSEIGKEEQVRKLHEMLAPHMLRRMKSDVLKDMPAKSEFIVRIELAPMQKKYYKHILTKNYEALNVRGHSNQTSLMNIMMDLRKCCNHPYLFPSADTEAPLTNKGFYEGSALVKSCGKLEMMAKMLKILKRDNHRVLIFSQMTRMLDILEDFCVHIGFGYERLDGGVGTKDRQQSIDRFNSLDSDSFVFLLSTRAGGLGINLATADTVIIYDMDWNPHNDIQAFSRAHRIGQKNRVMIYRFVSRSTVEERITQVAKKKMMLTELVIHGGMGGSTSEKNESLSKKEMQAILQFGAENLFKEEEEGSLEYSDAMVEKLLDRENVDEAIAVPVEGEEKGGMNEYLRSFKVASYTVKDGADIEDEQPPEEEVEPEPEMDPNYWQRVLGDAYEEHKTKIMQEEEALALTMGKGKRQRKQVNYAEALMMENMRKEAQKAAKAAAAAAAVEDKEEEDDGNDSDVKYMSDYEPDSSESEKDSEEENSEEEASPEPEYIAKQKQNEGGTQKGGRPPTKKEVVKEEKKKKGPTDLPPLMSKVGGHVEVLGFTARQRRAFLDAIMRYGMPPEDSYRSQWLVRDLRNKVDKVFKAYLSLFMRHLCEPPGEDPERYADGVPREGLSRQHVLTRIGMMALIRRKVHEFEPVNGTDSLAEFKLRPVFGTKGQQAAAPSKKDEKGKTPNGKEKTPNGKENAGKKDDSKKTDEKTPSKTDKKSPEKDDKTKSEPEKNEEKASDKSEEDKKQSSDDKKDDKKTDDTEKDVKEESDVKKETSSEKTESTSKSEEKQTTESKEDEKKADTKSDDTKDAKPSVKDDETGEVVKKENGEEKSADEKEKKDTTETKTETAKDDEKMEVDVKPETSKDSESKSEEKKDSSEDKEKTNDKEEKMDVDEGKEKKDDKKAEVSNPDDEKDEKSTSKTKSKAGEDTKSENADKKESDDSKDEKKKDSAKKDEEAKKKPEKPRTLRSRFFIGDGGFTELHALWQYEERFIRPGKEYSCWHRRHDYWLLCGIVTHGYRHWQDILNDPRFEVLNQAFQTDSDRMRKGAFLNRRFQLLEQALVVEEELRKEMETNPGVSKQLPPTAKGQEIDKFTPLDQLAAVLRQIFRSGQKSLDNRLHRLVTQLEGLVGDIRQAAYTSMPATLARPPAVQQTQQAPKPSPQSNMYQASQKMASVRQMLETQKKGDKVICID